MREEQSIHELLCAYVLDEASPEERVRVEAALAESEELRAERARLEATIGIVQASYAGDETLSPSAQAELFERAGMRRANAPTLAPPPFWSQPAFRMAAALALIVGGVLAGGQLLSPSSEQSELARAPEAAAEDQVAYRLDHEQKEGGESGALIPGTIDQDALAARATTRRSNDEKAGKKDELADLGYSGLPGEDSEADPFDRASRPAVRVPLAAYELEELEALGYEGAGAGDVDFDNVAFETAEPAEPAGEVLGLDFALGLGERRELDDRPADVERKRRSEAGPPAQERGAPTVIRGKGSGSGGSAGGVALRREQPASPRLEELGLASKAPTVYPSRAPVGSGGAPVGPPGPAGPVAGGPMTGSADFSLGRGSRAYTGGADGDPVGRLLYAFTNARDDVVLRLWLELRADRTDVSLSDLLIRECRRLPGESPSTMFHRYWGDNAFETTLHDPLSTFAVDVDTASYALARHYLKQGTVPPKAAVRTEEFVNYFAPDVEAPLEGVFAIHTDLAPSRFGGDPDRMMLRVVVRGREVSKDERKPLSLTFVVDTSGSMQKENRMELVKHAMRLLSGELDNNDSLAIVAFSSEARLVLPMTSIANRSVIESAIQGLSANGSTNAEAGLKLGYALAHAALHPNANNRVVLLSDGVANVGQTDQDKICAEVAKHREAGIYLNTIGVGLGNHNDTFLEQLANKGDGLCNYVDGEREARRAIVDNFTGAFEPIARDVKIQVEFDPAQVERYRLLGYENRAVRDQDFRNDAVDAGEVGAGHQVTALYELVRVPASSSTTPLATARLRFKPPHGAEVADPEKATEIAHGILASQAAGSFEATSAGYRRAVLVAQFAEFLRRSVHCRNDSLDELIAESKKLEGELADADFSEFVSLLEQSRHLVLQSLPKYDELSRAIDALREREILLARYEAALDEEAARQKLEDTEFLQRIETENRELEEKIRELIEKRLKDASGGTWEER